MDASEVTDQSHEAVEAEHTERRDEERFRTRGAILVGVLAKVLAIAGLGGENTPRALRNANLHARDPWAFDQAKRSGRLSTNLWRTRWRRPWSGSRPSWRRTSAAGQR